MADGYIILTVGHENRQQSQGIKLAATKGADDIYTLAVGGSGAGSGVVLGGSQRTPAITTVTSSGSVAAGKKYIGFIFSTDFAGTVDGETFAGPADSFIDFTAPPGDTLGAIAYTVTAGNIRIQTIT